MDMMSLSSLWNRKETLGSYEDIIEENILWRFKETRRERTQSILLNQKDLRQGGEKAAAALLFCQKDNILLLGNSISPQIQQKTISVETLLPQWEPNKISDFLSRSIFVLADEEGQVNFYHRDIKEYLVAYWLKKKIEERGSLSKVYPYIFGKGYNKEFIFDVMKPIAGGLAIWNKRIRKKLLRIDPITLFEARNLSQLAKKDRIKLFKKIG